MTCQRRILKVSIGLMSVLVMTSFHTALAQSGLTGDFVLREFGVGATKGGDPSTPAEPIVLRQLNDEARERYGSHYVSGKSYSYGSTLATKGRNAINGECYYIEVPEGYISHFEWLPDDYFEASNNDGELNAAVESALIYEYLYAIGQRNRRRVSDQIFLDALVQAGASDEAIEIAKTQIVRKRPLKYGSKQAQLVAEKADDLEIVELDEDLALSGRTCPNSST